MGCCISSTPKNDQNALQTHEAKCSVSQTKTQSKSPPLVEEEFVKEVLSETETPISKPQQVSILRPETETQMQNMNIRKDPIMNKALEEPSEEVSIISETCSVGESFSTTTTTTVPENREDEVTSKPSIRRNRNRNRAHSDASRKRSYAVEGNRIEGRDRRQPKSPARLPENPPEKKFVVDSQQVRPREFPDKVRHDSGKGSGRRSRSPSCHRTVGSSSTYRSELRQTDRAGPRLPPPGKCDSEEVIEETNDSVSMDELLMNPHVSMECFIFL